MSCTVLVRVYPKLEYTLIQTETMQRRKLLLATGGALATATAGCLGTNSGSEPAAQSDVDVEVEFFLDDGDLVAGHISGDVLESGQSVYITIGGDQVQEKTLDSDVHTGGEIIRVIDVESEGSGRYRVGLYLQRSNGSEEIAVGTVGSSSLNQPAPQTQIDFDYNASAKEAVVYHDGGASITTDNTGELGISMTNADSATTDMSNVYSTESYIGSDGVVAVPGISAGDKIATISDVESGDRIEVIWNSLDGGNSQALGSFEAP